MPGLGGGGHHHASGWLHLHNWLLRSFLGSDSAPTCGSVRRQGTNKVVAEYACEASQEHSAFRENDPSVPPYMRFEHRHSQCTQAHTRTLKVGQAQRLTKLEHSISTSCLPCPCERAIRRMQKYAGILLMDMPAPHAILLLK